MTDICSDVLLVCQLDGYANSVRPGQIAGYLRKRGIAVDVMSTESLGRLGTGTITRWMPGIRPREWPLYICEVLNDLAGISNLLRSRCVRLRSALLGKAIRRRGLLASRRIKPGSYAIVICESNMDASFVLHRRVANIQILDLPVPFAEERYFAGDLDEQGFDRLRHLEAEIYQSADHLSFHWHTYSEFVQEHKYSGSNWLALSYGTTTKSVRATHSPEPRIVFLGLLRGEWVNLPLLERLCALYPGIDIFGGPEPTGALRRNYRGYAPSLDVLANYQFGLTTISRDPLRRRSFSSKHLEYISYGLPVLTPAWRQDDVLEPSSIYFTEDTFVDQIMAMNRPDTWKTMSDSSLELAEKLTWDSALRPLGNIVKGVFSCTP
jgi:hypothetical protein